VAAAPLMPVAALIEDDDFFRWGADDAPVGTSMVVTYGFMAAVPSYETRSARPNFLAFDEAKKASARTALDIWPSISGLAFVEVAPGYGQIRFVLHDFAPTEYSGFAGYAYLSAAARDLTRFMATRAMTASGADLVATFCSAMVTARMGMTSWKVGRESM
jgi:hypothetical protein